MTVAEPTLVQRLLSLITPGEASAEVMSLSSDAAKKLASIAEAPGASYLDRMYRTVLEAAQRHPEAATFVPDESLADRGMIGAYNPRTRNILYEPGLSGDQTKNTFTHELMHFLSAQDRSKMSVERQHDLIRTFLGGDTPKKGYTLPPLVSFEDLSGLHSMLWPISSTYRTRDIAEPVRKATQ
jgi:hypothetical protein